LGLLAEIIIFFFLSFFKCLCVLQVCEESPLSFIPPVHQTSTNTSCANGQERQTATVEDTRKQHELLLLALKLKHGLTDEVLLLALKLKHGLTDEALEDTLKVVNVISQRHAVSSTKHHFNKTFDDLKRNIQFHYICEGCTISVNIEGEKVVCPNCQYSCSVADHMKKGHFFIVYNMMEQEELFSQLTRPNSGAHSSPLQISLLVSFTRGLTEMLKANLCITSISH